MKTGMNLRPLWTANVRPTIDGMTIERREYVVTTRFAGFDSLAARAIFLGRYASTNGPFFVERGIGLSTFGSLAAADDELLGPLVVTGLEALGLDAPRS